MLRFNKNVEERKTIAHRLGELTGIQPFYTRAPLYTYEVGPYVIDRGGDLLVDENQADPEVLTALMSEGLITGGEVIGTDAPVDEGEFPAGEENPFTEETPDAEEIPAAEETPEEDADPQEMDTVPQEDSGDVPDSEEPEHERPSEPDEEDAPTEEGNSTDPSAPDEAADESVDMGMNFPIPIGQHSGTTLRNLVNLIYSRGALVSKATGGHFSADEELVEALKDDTCTFTKANFLAMLSDYEAQHGEALHGLKITEDEVIFTGFGRAADMDTLTAYLRRMEPEDALQRLSEIIKPKVISLNEGGVPLPVQSVVEGAKLASFIDDAVADSIERLESREDDMSQVVAAVLKNIDGKHFVETMSVEVIQFIADA